VGDRDSLSARPPSQATASESCGNLLVHWQAAVTVEAPLHLVKFTESESSDRDMPSRWQWLQTVKFTETCRDSWLTFRNTNWFWARAVTV
jgi:hypothetical protein